MNGVRDAMIVAGGAGTRLRPLTDTTPKPLLPFCGAPFLTGVIRRLADVGVRRVHLVVGRDTSPFEVVRADAAAHAVEVLMVPEPEPLDTAGGVRAAVDQVEGSFLVLNGDILAGVDLTAAVEAHRRADAMATIVLTRVEDTSTYGVCVREGSRIVAFVEKPEPGTLPGQDTVNAGTYVLEPDALTGFPVGRLSFERQVFPGLVAGGHHVEGFVDDGVWADLGTPERFRHGHRLALDGAVSWPTLADVPDVGEGVRLAPDAEVAAGAVIDGPVLIGPGVSIGDGARIGPYAVVGAGTRVGASAQVQDSVVFDRVHIGEGARVAGALVGFDAEVGVRADLDGDSVLGDRASVADGETLARGRRRPAP